MNTIPVKFKWVSAETDPQPYKPGKPLLEPIEVTVIVDVPQTGEYIYNLEDGIKAQLYADNNPKTILTPKGMAYCIKQLKDALAEDEPEHTTWNNQDWSDADFDEETISEDDFEPI